MSKFVCVVDGRHAQMASNGIGRITQIGDSLSVINPTWQILFAGRDEKGRPQVWEHSSELPKDGIFNNSNLRAADEMIWWHKYGLPLLLRITKPNVVILPNYGTWLDLGVPTVCYIHDLYHHLFFKPSTPILKHLIPNSKFDSSQNPHTEAAPFKATVPLVVWARSIERNINWSFRYALGVVTPSEWTRQDILSRYPVANPDRIWAVPNGFDATVFQALPVESDSIPEPLRGKPYVLCVARRNRKQVHRAIEAVQGLRQSGVDLKIVLVGQEENSGDYPHDESIYQAGFVTDSELAALYGGAVAVLMTFDYEGFGLPALEAMACGAPVIASGMGALPEVVGDAGVIVTSPDNINEWMDAILSVMQDQQLRNDLAKKGIVRAASMTWERNAALLSGRICESL